MASSLPRHSSHAPLRVSRGASGELAKNSSVAPSAGLPQLLTYTYKSLERQKSVWGLATNAELYQFVYIQQGNPPTYQQMPILSLMDVEPSIQLLQVLKAICQRLGSTQRQQRDGAAQNPHD